MSRKVSDAGYYDSQGFAQNAKHTWQVQPAPFGSRRMLIQEGKQGQGQTLNLN